jgi:signal transduction histidine kinase
MNVDSFKFLDNVPMGIFVLRGDYTVLFWNYCIEDWTGIARDEILGTNICDRFDHFCKAAYTSRIEPIFAGGPPTIFSSQLHKNIIPSVMVNGQLRVQHTTVTTLPSPVESGEGFYALFAVQDVTELTLRATQYKTLRDQALEEVKMRQKAEQELMELNRNLEDIVVAEIKKRLQHEELLIQKSKMAAMGEMLAAIAHQWKTPLTGLGLLINDVKDSYEYGELTQNYIDEIYKKSNGLITFMARTIDDFRNFFRPDKEKQFFDVKQAVSSTLELFAAQIRHNKITIGMTSGDGRVDESFGSFGYPNEFKQVVLNIINNARDSILERLDGEGEDSGFCGKIVIELRLQDGEILILIKDNGGGIDEKILEKIFDPYFTTKDDKKGTGIGLYMSKLIIENNMGGTIFARNLDDGAEFVMKLKKFEPNNLSFPAKYPAVQNGDSPELKWS